jgi:hypothetical protein
VTSGRLRESKSQGRAAGHAHCRETPPVRAAAPGASGSANRSRKKIRHESYQRLAMHR